MSDSSTIRVFRFADTGLAYDASQCDDEIRDGDILVVESERVVGVLVGAWPVAVTSEHGQFHTLEQGLDLADYEDGRYHGSARCADMLAAKEGWVK